MAGHRHKWERYHAGYVAGGTHAGLVAITHRCSCGAVMGFTAGSSHEMAAELGHKLEAMGDGFLGPQARAWLSARRCFMNPAF